ncbi:MAG: hypothetical protein AAF432_14500 [Planctomycetota bacterium]
MYHTHETTSLTDFRQNLKAHLDHLATTRGIEFVTVNGETKGVVMAPDTYDMLARRAYEGDIAAAIDRGIKEIENGQGIDARIAMRQLAEKFGLTLDQ